MLIRVRECDLADGLFFLRAVRRQSAQAEIALRPDAEGYVALDFGSDGQDLTILIHEDPGAARAWTISPSLLAQYRAGNLDPTALVDEAGRDLQRHAVVGVRWTIREWLAVFGPQFGVTSPRYVRQMCRGEVIGRTKYRIKRQYTPCHAKLPPPFRGVQDEAGGRWFITA